MPDLETVERRIRRYLIIAAWIIIPLTAIVGVLTQAFKESAASRPTTGRLHNRYGANEETPWVDVAADRGTLETWRVIFLQGHGEHGSSVAGIAQDYGKLVSSGKLTSVAPDTQVRITQREGETDCRVTILSGSKTDQSGWVDCRSIYH